MKILMPDSWLREFLKTEATPTQIKEYLSLSGPSVERIHQQNGEQVYEIEVTSNRPDTMSVVGIAREAAAILPQFGINAILINDPYQINGKKFLQSPSKSGLKKLSIITNSLLNPRWTSIVLDRVSVKPSPAWLQKRLELTGLRPLNNIIDITNYLMRAFGQPAHAFDYDRIKPNREGIPTMILRESERGEKLTTLDGKRHTLPGGDIVIEDGAGRLIDLCGIMGAENSSIKETTKTVVLFMQTYNPVNIRRTSMTLAHRTEAAQLFEKGLDSELVLPTVVKGVELIKEVTGGHAVSQLYDIYPLPYQPKSVKLLKSKLNSYLGKTLSNQQIVQMLLPLSLQCQFEKDTIIVTVPSFRQDIEIDVDIVEEIARIYGYHNVVPTLPETAPPVGQPDPLLRWEEEVKVRLRDWGFTEVYSYSMISEELMDIFNFDKTNAYKIANPLSSEWVYMRPGIWPSVVKVVQQNLNHRLEFKLFELSMRYSYRKSDLPSEEPVLLVVWTGERLLEAKGVAEALFDLFGIPFPKLNSDTQPLDWYDHRRLDLGEFGSVGVVNSLLLHRLQIKSPLTVLELEFTNLVKHSQLIKRYLPIPKYPPIIEDFSFILPPRTLIGGVLTELPKVSSLIHKIELLDRYQDTVTFRVYFLNRQEPLSSLAIIPIKVKLKQLVESLFNGTLKESIPATDLLKGVAK